MSAPRLTAAMQASALIRAAAMHGGVGTVLAHGDDVAGALLILIASRGTVTALRERGLRPDGNWGWVATGPSDPSDAAALADYVARRRRSDPDLWVVELDGVDPATVDALLGAD